MNIEKKLLQLIQVWREYADGEYCRTYNKERGTTLKMCADDVEKLLNSMHSEEDTKAKVLALISENENNYVGRAMLFLFNQQTQSEKSSGTTSENNGVGFNSVDSRFGSNIAKWYQEHNFLTIKQLESSKKILIKYAGQLARAGFDE